MYASHHQRVEGSADFVIFEVCGCSNNEFLIGGRAADSPKGESRSCLPRVARDRSWDVVVSLRAAIARWGQALHYLRFRQ